MSVALRALIVEDSEDDALLIARELRRGGYDLTFIRVETPDAMIAELDKQVWEVVICDYVMPHFSAPAALSLFTEKGFDLPFIVITGKIGEETAVATMKAGAHDVILKDNLSRLVPAVERELREAEERRARREAEEALHSLRVFNERVVQSIQDGLVTLDLDFRITFWNKGMEEISGYEAEEMLGQIAYDVFPHFIEQGVDKLHKAALEGQTVTRQNIPFVTPRGRAEYANEKYLPLRDETGEIAGVLIIVEDVTEVLRQEQQVVRLGLEIERRKFVEIAKGILMHELGLSEADSFQFIQKKSQEESKKMLEIAKQVIEFFGSREDVRKIS